jgi:hypothetical protein
MAGEVEDGDDGQGGSGPTRQADGGGEDAQRGRGSDEEDGEPPRSHLLIIALLLRRGQVLCEDVSPTRAT